MAELPPGDLHPGRLEEHRGQSMEGMKSHPASLPLNPELVQNRMEDFLDHPPPVIRAAQLIGEEQVMRVPYEVFLEQLFDDWRHRYRGLRLLRLHGLGLPVQRAPANPDEAVIKVQVRSCVSLAKTGELQNDTQPFVSLDSYLEK